MTSIERTAYPRFRRLVTARERVELTPTAEAQRELVRERVGAVLDP